MAAFVMRSPLIEGGAGTIASDPERIKTVNAVLGPDDVVNVVEAPDDLTVARVATEHSAPDSIRRLTMPAIPGDDVIAGLASG